MCDWHHTLRKDPPNSLFLICDLLQTPVRHGPSLSCALKIISLQPPSDHYNLDSFLMGLICSHTQSIKYTLMRFYSSILSWAVDEFTMKAIYGGHHAFENKNHAHEGGQDSLNFLLLRWCLTLLFVYFFTEAWFTAWTEALVTVRSCWSGCSEAPGPPQYQVFY